VNHHLHLPSSHPAVFTRHRPQPFHMPMRPIYLISKYYPNSQNHNYNHNPSITSPRNQLEHRKETTQIKETSLRSVPPNQPTSQSNPTEMANPYSPNLPPLSTIHPPKYRPPSKSHPESNGEWFWKLSPYLPTLWIRDGQFITLEILKELEGPYLPNIFLALQSVDVLA